MTWRAALVASSVLLTVPVHATGPSWPIFTDVTFPETVGPDGGRATVVVTVAADATDIRIEVYGDDRMRVDPDNKLVVQLSTLHPGESFPFEVGFHPGPGRSYIAVSAYAHFAHSYGGAVHEFPFGQEDAAQLREHRRCVRQDSDGTWIKLMGCDEADPPAPADAPAPAQAAHGGPGGSPPPTLSVEQLRSTPPLGQHVHLEGFVVDSYRCPPCPRGAQCKPCVMESVIFVSSAPAHERFSWTAPPPDVVTVAASDPTAFAAGVRYRFEVQVPEQARSGGVDGRLVRSQRADEPVWREPAAESVPAARAS